MDAGRFGTLLRSLSSRPSRRGALAGLIGGVADLLVLRHSSEAAGRRRCRRPCGDCKRCRRGRCHKTNHGKRCQRGECKPKPNGTACANYGSCQGGTCIPHICAGQNACQAGFTVSGCHRNGASTTCVCLVTADGAPFCGAGGFTSDCSTTPCPAGETCINDYGPFCGGGLRCGQPCPEPR